MHALNIVLTQWPLGDWAVIWIVAWALAKLLWGECYQTLLIKSQHWFRWWLGAVRQQAITVLKINPFLCCHMTSQVHNGLTFYLIFMFCNLLHLLFLSRMKFLKWHVEALFVWCPVLSRHICFNGIWYGEGISLHKLVSVNGNILQIIQIE